jgi:hypothetical protein
MADQRLLLRHGAHEIVLAVRHGDEWRSARDAENDIGSFLTELPHGATLVIGYEHAPECNDTALLTDKINAWRVTYRILMERALRVIEARLKNAVDEHSAGMDIETYPFITKEIDAMRQELMTPAVQE